MAAAPNANRPSLPPELEREIFETTAVMHPREIPTLLRVARRVLIWIEPLLYRVIRLSKFNVDLMSLLKSKPAAFLQNAVRHLCFDSYGDAGQAKGILELCTGVVDLALEMAPANPILLPILATMSLRRLSTFLHDLFGDDINLGHPTFAFLTHLDLLDDDDNHLALILPHIPSLPALTHLALDYKVPRNTVQTLLEKCPRLALLACLWHWHMVAGYHAAQTPHVYDVRFVIGRCRELYWADWEDCARGRTHLWSLGEDFVARKRSGDIEKTCYWLPSEI
ncbi:hypothetical protein B0H19DRAFT_1274215 [Mycena capillaripes]|nr:hypothetical protein B0H19DRAFT_1274215 [Mycena capillaripes]